MIIIKLKYGLGNQMFQYALGEAIKDSGYKGKILFDLEHYEIDESHTGYSLEKYFNIKLEFATVEQRKKLTCVELWPKNYQQMPQVIRVLFRKYRRFQDVYNFYKGKPWPTYLNVHKFNVYDPDLFNIPEFKDIYIEGFFQTERYYRDILPKLRKTFAFTGSLSEDDEKLLERMQNTNSVCVHVRRGDYVDSNFDLCSMNYFKKAVEIARAKGGDTFFVFSDDPDYVREEFSFLNDYTVVDHGTEKCNYDLYLMSRCKMNIISNSTFALWGALLNENPSLVVAPKYWIVYDNIMRDLEVPEGWVVLDNNERQK